MLQLDLSDIEGFEWDEGNVHKNKQKHDVVPDECEELFNQKPLVFFPDEKHSQTERRILALGKTSRDRLLALSFTLRNKRIRVISVRSQSRRERIFYKKIETNYFTRLHTHHET